MKHSIKKSLIVIPFLLIGSMGYSLKAYSNNVNSVTTNGVVVFTTGSTTSTTASDSTASTTASDSTTKNTKVKAYPKTGENSGQSLLIRSLGLVIVGIVVAVFVRKYPLLKNKKSE